MCARPTAEPPSEDRVFQVRGRKVRATVRNLGPLVPRDLPYVELPGQPFPPYHYTET
jgi:hypothetical protein